VNFASNGVLEGAKVLEIVRERGLLMSIDGVSCQPSGGHIEIGPVRTRWLIVVWEGCVFVSAPVIVVRCGASMRLAVP
jgi:hypothetical protein